MNHIQLLRVICFVTIILFNDSCDQKIAGIKKDLTTGLTTTYSGIEPSETFMMMNDELINHTDIPLGEKFIVVNDGVKGMVIKDGKVKVGCYLKIVDSAGAILLEERDLFAGNDEFPEKDARMLKCTVSTGKPMKWEEDYFVTVSFWDKQGKGRIDNAVTIKTIDIP